MKTGNELEISSSGRRASVRALQSLGIPVDDADAVYRVAVNLRGVTPDDVERGDALLTPGRFWRTDVIDVRVVGDAVTSLPRMVMLHVGTAAEPARVRPLGSDTARLTLTDALPLHVGDRGLLRDPGRHHVAGGVTVLDVAPPALTRRGAGRARTATLAGLDGTPDAHSELRRRGWVRQEVLERMGVPPTDPPKAAGWLVDDELWSRLRSELPDLVTNWREDRPLEPGPPVDAICRRLGLPDRSVVNALVEPPLQLLEERGHYDVAMACAEDQLMPAVRSADDGTLVIADGFSCQTQIERADATTTPLHSAEVLAAGVLGQEPGQRRPRSPSRSAKAGAGIAAAGLVVGPVAAVPRRFGARAGHA